MKQYKLPEPVTEINHPSHIIKQEAQEPVLNERPIENEKLTASGVLKIIEHNASVFFQDSSIPLSTDFVERVLPLIFNQMGPAPSHFRNDDQEHVMRTVANENEHKNGSTNGPNHKFTDSTEIQRR